MLIGLYTSCKFPDPYLNFGGPANPHYVRSALRFRSRKRSASSFHLRITTTPRLYASEVARPSSCSVTVRERSWAEFCSSFIA